MSELILRRNTSVGCLQLSPLIFSSAHAIAAVARTRQTLRSIVGVVALRRAGVSLHAAFAFPPSLRAVAPLLTKTEREE